MALVKFRKSLSSTNYDLLVKGQLTEFGYKAGDTPDENTLYFITDGAKQIYLGTDLVGEGSAITKIKTAKVDKDGPEITLTIGDLNGVEANQSIEAKTKCKITYDAKGLVTAGADLAATDIPLLPASKISSGTFDAALIPTLAISKINSEAFLTAPSATNKVATKSDLDAAVAGASNYLGTITALSQLSTAAKKGDFYRVATAWDGVHVGDILIAEKDSPKARISDDGYALLHNEINTDTITEIGVANFNPGEGKAEIIPNVSQLQRDDDGNIVGFKSGTKVILGDVVTKQVAYALGGSEGDDTLPTSEAVKTYVGGVEDDLQEAINAINTNLGNTNFVNTLNTSDHITGAGAVNITNTSTGNIILGNAAEHVVETAGDGIIHASTPENKAKLPTSEAVKDFVTSELVAPKANIATNAANILEIAHAMTWDYEG